MDNEILEAVQTVLNREKEDKYTLPQRLLEIPKDCFVNPRPPKVWGRTMDFLSLLDSEVRKAPAKGILLKDACKLMEHFGSPISVNGLQVLLGRTVRVHTLTVLGGRVRLSTKELLEKIARERLLKVS